MGYCQARLPLFGVRGGLPDLLSFRQSMWTIPLLWQKPILWSDILATIGVYFIHSIIRNTPQTIHLTDRDTRGVRLLAEQRHFVSAASCLGCDRNRPAWRSKT